MDARYKVSGWLFFIVFFMMFLIISLSKGINLHSQLPAIEIAGLKEPRATEK